MGTCTESVMQGAASNGGPAGTAVFKARNNSTLFYMYAHGQVTTMSHIMSTSALSSALTDLPNTCDSELSEHLVMSGQ